MPDTPQLKSSGYHPTNPSGFPVNIGANLAAQPWFPTPQTDLSLIHKAANESGPDYPHFEQVLCQWAIHLQTYYDWYLMKAMPKPTIFLNWQVAYDDQAEMQACLNIQYNIAIFLDMLTSRGQYVNPVTQAQIGLPPYFQQVSETEFKALNSCTTWNLTAYFCNLIQQPRELFTDLLAQVNEAVEKWVDPDPTRKMLIKQLTWEGLNASYPKCSCSST